MYVHVQCTCQKKTILPDNWFGVVRQPLAPNACSVIMTDLLNMKFASSLSSIPILEIGGNSNPYKVRYILSSYVHRLEYMSCIQIKGLLLYVLKLQLRFKVWHWMWDDPELDIMYFISKSVCSLMRYLPAQSSKSLVQACP